jgi:hypothetical protein
LVKKAMQSALDIWSTLWVMLYSTIARHVPHIALEPHSAETANSASHMEGHCQAALTGFQKIKPLLSSQPIRWQIVACDSVLDSSNPNTDVEAYLITTFMGSMRRIPHPEVTVVGVRCTSHGKHALSIHRMLHKESSFTVC